MQKYAALSSPVSPLGRPCLEPLSPPPPPVTPSPLPTELPRPTTLLLQSALQREQQALSAAATVLQDARRAGGQRKLGASSSSAAPSAARDPTVGPPLRANWSTMSAENLRIVLRQERDDKLALEQLNAHLYMQLQLAPKHLAQQSARELACVQAELRAAAVVACMAVACSVAVRAAARVAARAAARVAARARETMTAAAPTAAAAAAAVVTVAARAAARAEGDDWESVQAIKWRKGQLKQAVSASAGKQESARTHNTFYSNAKNLVAGTKRLADG